MANLAGFLIDALYPRRCRSCGQPSNYDNVAEVGGRSTGFFCTQCASDVSPIKSPFCTVCGMPFPDGAGSDHPCSDCISHRTYYHSARSAAVYKGTLKDAVHLYKYVGIQAMHQFLGPLVADAAREFFPDAHVAAAVPLHRRRLGEERVQPVAIPGEVRGGGSLHSAIFGWIGEDSLYTPAGGP